MIKLYLCVSMQELKFTIAVTKMKGYFEAFFEQPPPFKLSLVEINTEETVWSATIREGTRNKKQKKTLNVQSFPSTSVFCCCLRRLCD